MIDNTLAEMIVKGMESKKLRRFDVTTNFGVVEVKADSVSVGDTLQFFIGTEVIAAFQQWASFVELLGRRFKKKSEEVVSE